MAGGPRKHLKRIAAPKHWCLDKLGGIYAPRPSLGPHSLRHCIPMALLLRNQLKYAVTYAEVKMIMAQRLIKVDHKIRTDRTFPLGFMDVITIDKTKENFRILLDVKGRFVPVKITPEEAQFKLCRVRHVRICKERIPHAYTHDQRTFRYVHPTVKVNDTLKIDLTTGKIVGHYKFNIGSLAMLTQGNSIGRVGTIMERKKTIGGVEMVVLKDARGQIFTTKVENVFVIGENEPLVTLPRKQGIKTSILEDQQARLAAAK